MTRRPARRRTAVAATAGAVLAAGALAVGAGTAGADSRGNGEKHAKPATKAQVLALFDQLERRAADR